MRCMQPTHLLGVWAQLKLSSLHGFPLWEGDVHTALLGGFAELKSIFRAYASGSIEVRHRTCLWLTPHLPMAGTALTYG